MTPLLAWFDGGKRRDKDVPAEYMAGSAVIQLPDGDRRAFLKRCAALNSEEAEWEGALLATKGILSYLNDPTEKRVSNVILYGDCEAVIRVLQTRWDKPDEKTPGRILSTLYRAKRIDQHGVNYPQHKAGGLHLIHPMDVSIQ